MFRQLVRLVNLNTIFSITFHSSSFFRCLVKISLPQTYPRVSPKVEIIESRGLTQSDLSNIRSNVESITKNKLGEVVCHEILLAVQSYLEENNYPPQTAYDAMVSRERRERKALDDLRRSNQYHITEEGQVTEVFDSLDHIKISAADPLEKSEASNDLDTLTALLEAENKKEIAENAVQFYSKYSKAGVSSLMDLEDHDEESDSDFLSDEDDYDPMIATGMNLVGPGNDRATSSRYHHEFVEISCLGKGAFGQVWKVRNRLDRRTYAVKKISLYQESSAESKKIRREVTTISRLLHKHVVRYFAAWVEAVDLNSFPGKTSTDDESDEDESGEENDSVSSTGSDFNDIDRHQKQLNYFSHDYLNDYNNSTNFDVDVTFGSQSESDSDDKSAEVATPNITEKPQKHQQPQQMQQRMLFIQMEYCQTNLRKVIDQGYVWKDNQEIFRLLRQMLEALAYVHSKGVIHRDLKVISYVQAN